MSSAKIKIHYVTSSLFKQEENRIFCQECKLKDGTTVGDVFEFSFRTEEIKEILEVDLSLMVKAEVANAYSKLKVPCIVEHAGLIFDEFRSDSYPGGLTKPMWNTLGDKFIEETRSSGRKVTARALIGYCDGTTVLTFEGETQGTLAATLRGSRDFYWDTVFIPDDASGKALGKTYAEIVEDSSLGLSYKVRELSQSSKAMLNFLEYRVSNGPSLWGP